MKKIFVLLSFAFLVVSCSESRTKAEGEMIQSEFVYEENGIYYEHAVNHEKVKYSGTCLFFWPSNALKKGRAFIEKGLPEGHWEYWNEDGSKKLDLYFKEGELINKD